MNIQKEIRKGVAELSRDQIIEQLAFLDCLLNSGDMTGMPWSLNDVKSLKSKLISRLKQMKTEK